MKVILIDDDDLVTVSLKTIIEAENGLEVVGIAGDGAVALKLYQDTRPDIVLMDIRMENVNGIEASREILSYDPNAKILLLTTFKDEEYIVDALELGVKGYVLKQDYTSIIPALQAIHANQTVYNSDILRKTKTISPKTENNIGKFDLTEKEIEIIEQIALGLNNKEISQKIFLSEGTIRNYISNIFLKLNLRDRTQLAIFYYTQIKG